MQKQIATLFGIAVLFVALALAMFDVFEIDFSKYSANVRTGSSRGSVMLAFTMGGVAALARAQSAKGIFHPSLITLFDVVPLYLRKSDAEIAWDNRDRGTGA